jgi:hypothetical protein
VDAQDRGGFVKQIGQILCFPAVLLVALCLLLSPGLTSHFFYSTPGYSLNVNQTLCAGQKTSNGQREIQDRLLDMQVSSIGAVLSQNSG